ncbi:MAG: hypothetical protein WCQ00_03165 [bacterium]
MSDIQFEEENKYSAQSFANGSRNFAVAQNPAKKGLKSFFMSWGLFKNDTQVNYFMLGIVVVCIVVTFVCLKSFFGFTIFSGGEPSQTIDPANPPLFNFKNHVTQ